MAMKRSFLEGLGLDEKQVNAIIEANEDSLSAVKAQRDAYKADSEKLAEVQKKLDDANKALEAGKKDTYKVKYEALKEDFDNYKADTEKKAAHGAKESAYRELLKKAGVSEKRIDAILRVSDVDEVELDENGTIKDATERTKSIKSEWADFIVKAKTEGAKVENPAENGGAKTKDDIMKIKDAGERQAAIAENHELFGF